MTDPVRADYKSAPGFHTAVFFLAPHRRECLESAQRHQHLNISPPRLCLTDLPSTMSKHPEPRPRPANAAKAGEPYHFDENPLRALTLEEALQDAKTYYKTAASARQSLMQSRVNDATDRKRVRVAARHPEQARPS